MEELVTLLKAFRERAGLSQNELSVKSGLSETYYGKIENELRRPSTGALLHILQALGCLPHEQEQAVRLFTAARFPGLLESLTPRPQPGTAGAVVPSPKRRRRRAFGALLLVVALACSPTTARAASGTCSLLSDIRRWRAALGQWGRTWQPAC